jgi:hypothetical protein
MSGRPNVAKIIRTFAIWAVADRLFRFLGKGVMNNWTNDTYDWSREIVVVTGGSDGIGACIVKLLSELKIKVVILDIQQPKFTRRCSGLPSDRLTSSSATECALLQVRSGVACGNLSYRNWDLANRWFADDTGQ